MHYTPTELTRLVGYLAGIAAGLAFVAYGLIKGDLATAIAGASALGVSITAAPNVNKSVVDAPDDLDFEVIVEDTE